jgi:CheY-like chemotaxis protein
VLRTLIVEDNIAFRQSLGGILREALPDAQVSEAGDGDEALRQIAAAEPDFIFMDIRLPGENGLRLTKRIKAAHPDNPCAGQRPSPATEFPPRERPLSASLTKPYPKWGKILPRNGGAFRLCRFP